MAKNYIIVPDGLGVDLEIATSLKEAKKLRRKVIKDNASELPFGLGKREFVDAKIMPHSVAYVRHLLKQGYSAGRTFKKLKKVI